MHGAQENVVFRRDAKESGAEQRRFLKIEGCLYLGFRQLIGLRIEIARANHISDRKIQREFVSNNLYQFATFKPEGGAQAVMAIHDLLQARPEGGPVEWSSQP